MAKYNGYKNYQTWNVALWIGNDEGLYNIARQCRNYADFQSEMREFGSFETPDGVAWNDSGLSVSELNAVIKDLRN